MVFYSFIFIENDSMENVNSEVSQTYITIANNMEDGTIW